MAKGRLVVGACVGLALAYVSTLSLFWNAGDRVPAGMALGSLGSHPEDVLEEASANFLADGDLEKINLGQLRSATALAPLEEQAFVFAAAQRAAAGDAASAEELLEIAVRRNPRTREGRALLIEQLGQRGEIRGSVQQIEVLYRLLPSQRPAFREALVYLASDPATRQQTINALSEDPLKRVVLEGLAGSGASASMLLETLEAFGEFDLGENPSAVARPLLAAGDGQGAARVWSALNPGAFEAEPLLRDPQFTGTAPAPFGWEVRSDRFGYATLGDPGLEGEAYRRRRSLLARQYTLLGPGKYRLTIDNELVGRGVQLRISCLEGAPLAEEPLSERVQRIDFAIPQDCGPAEIGFYAMPGDPPVPSSFRIRQVTLERAST